MSEKDLIQEFETPATYDVRENETCLTALINQVQARPFGVLFHKPANYEWVNVTAREFLDEIYDVAKGLINAGVEQGDRVVLLSATRYEWSVLDYAIWAAGAASVPIYPSSSPSQIQWIVENSGAVLAISETREHTEYLSHLVLREDGTPALSDSPSQLRRVVELNASGMETLKFEGRKVDTEQVEERVRNTSADDLASIVYTSGTTGRPKGCHHTHRNWLSEVRALLSHPIGSIARPGARMITYLPLAHVLARAISLAAAIAGATQTHWADPSTLPVELKRVRPHLLLGVPRVFEKVRNAAAQSAADSSPVAKLIFDRAEQTAIEYSMAQDTEEGPSKGLKLRHRLYDRLVYAKLHEAVGGEVEYAITGSSAISPELLHFFRGIGLPIYEGYGLTETCAACAVDFEPNQKIGTVGTPVGGTAFKINDDGELCVKGEILFKEYWRNEEATREAFDEDGWYNTGDLGEIDSSGHITITGRKKDLIVTAGGKNVSPGPMEDLLRNHPLISQALVVGDGKPFVGVLLTLDEETLGRWKKEHDVPSSKPVKEMAKDPALRAEIQDAINKVNTTVSHAEGIKKYFILDRELTEEDEELTPTMKIKRNVVARRYEDAIDWIYRR